MFSAVGSPEIGSRIRVFSSEQMYCDGAVDCVLAGSLNGGVDLFHVLLDNGAETCVTGADMQHCRAYLVLGVRELTAARFRDELSSTMRRLSAVIAAINTDTGDIGEIECHWRCRGTSFFLHSFSSARAASVALGIAVQVVSDSCRRQASKKQQQSAPCVAFRLAETVSQVRASTRREVHTDVIRVLLASPSDLPSPLPANLGSNLRVSCLAADESVLLQFADIAHAAVALSIPVSGLKLALLGRGDQVVPFAGLLWRHDPPDAAAERHPVPVEVVHAMVLARNSEWVPVGGDMAPEGASSSSGSSSSDSSGGISAPPPEASGALTCLSLDEVPLFAFAGMVELCAAMDGCRPLMVHLCCLGALQHYLGFKWRFGDCLERRASPLPESEVRQSLSGLVDAVVARDGGASQSPAEMDVEGADGSPWDAGDSSSSTKKVPIGANDVRSLANLLMRDYDPRLVLTVPERRAAGEEQGKGEEDEEEDDRSSEEAENSAAKEAELRAEGWLFSPADSEFIGLRVRRYFPDHGISDAQVAAFLPASLNEGDPLWHLVHDDGDREDVDLLRLLRSREHLLGNLQADPDEALEAAALLQKQLQQRQQTSSDFVSDGRLEKLRRLAVERSAVAGETIEAALLTKSQSRGPEDSAPVILTVCTLVVKSLAVSNKL